ncbi:hypothetical protein NPS01_30780 [Nocardioides psychrotolerans]|uniref:class I SAM-dependent methyltransferase n=1 Tax=Nocardioides psychrotolerans TaxID=1005945 RepID=UPI0011908628|nr:class I SAM-dependent methyltransferase [Nocardioides psychrotolerans]GEP39415.1 hypothetical protein NPS01_30780 [Nocardioides psychrotolerans]
MSNLARPSSPSETLGLLDAVISARAVAGVLPGLAPATYARDHACFETRSDQRRLIADHLVTVLADRRIGPISMLSVGCGDGALDARLAATLADVLPTRPVRYVGIDPYAGSAAAFVAALSDLDRESLETQVHVATFDEAPVAGPFDVITFVHSMYYVPRVAETLRAAFDLLGPGGELIVVNAPRGVLNALVGVLAPPLEGHRQWFSDDVVAGFAEAGQQLEEIVTLEGRLDLAVASDAVLDFTVQARLTPELRPLVRAYLHAVSVPDASGEMRVPHPVDVFCVKRSDL